MLAILLFGLLLSAAWAQTERVLYSFCAQTNCADGAYPGGITFDQKGNLYGTAGGGTYDYCGKNGNLGCGVIFKATPKGQETVLYSFCAQANCTDGADPSAGLIFDQKGNLFGTTYSGGAHGSGTVFKLTPAGKETVLYSFCAQANCDDGGDPSAGLVLDREGNLYGTTQYGGAHGVGVVFKLTPNGRETVLHTFCAQNNCPDGYNAEAGLIFDGKDTLYGTAEYGGAYGAGVVFKLTTKGKETVLYSFCSQTNCLDGQYPLASLVLDQKGNLYGTTVNGGAYKSSRCYTYYEGYGCGVVFRLTPKGRETVLYSFCAQNNCTDGSYPYAGLVLDRKGNLSGTTYYGGVSSSCNGNSYGCGVVFRLTPKGREKVLHSFCTQNNCTDGATPDAGLVLDQKGNLYGTTELGGAYAYGTVFELTP